MYLRRIMAFLGLLMVPIAIYAMWQTLVGGSTHTAFAQEVPPAVVGRVALVAGDLAFHAASENSWSAASLNYPVTSGDSFWTDQHSQAQMRIGPNTINMDHNTEIDVSALDQQVMQLSIPQGRTEIDLRRLERGQIAEIDIPTGRVRLLRPGVYDIDVGSGSKPAAVATFAGKAQFLGAGLGTEISAGNVAILTGTNPVTATFRRVVPDAFADWCNVHIDHEAQVASAHHIPPSMTGFADLDRYGRWERDPDYGEVWIPKNVSEHWAPYREGHWVWIPPWGWTWVDSEPWGFAPFHYGRWARLHGHWGWVPGNYHKHPVYAPALVAFVAAAQAAPGHGRKVGWFPLAPGEVYWPTYSHDRRYIEELNRPVVHNVTTIVNKTTINNIFIQAPQAGDKRFANRSAVTVVPQHVFTNAQPVAPHVMPATNPALQHFMQQAPVKVAPPVPQPVFNKTTAQPNAGTSLNEGRVPLAHATAVAAPPARRHPAMHLMPNTQTTHVSPPIGRGIAPTEQKPGSAQVPPPATAPAGRPAEKAPIEHVTPSTAHAMSPAMNKKQGQSTPVEQTTPAIHVPPIPHAASVAPHLEKPTQVAPLHGHVAPTIEHATPTTHVPPLAAHAMPTVVHPEKPTLVTPKQGPIKTPVEHTAPASHVPPPAEHVAPPVHITPLHALPRHVAPPEEKHMQAKPQAPHSATRVHVANPPVAKPAPHPAAHIEPHPPSRAATQPVPIHAANHSAPRPVLHQPEKKKLEEKM